MAGDGVVAGGGGSGRGWGLWQEMGDVAGDGVSGRGWGSL